jgi:hypothetical protein
MNPSVIIAIAALVGSCVGAAASIGATWISQRTQAIHQQTEARLRERESLYGEFITEASRLIVDAVQHSLERIDTLVNLYGILGRIRLLAGDSVLAEAERFARRIVDMYSKPNMSVDQIRAALDGDQFDPLKDFSTAGRIELMEIANSVQLRKAGL